jgi:8-oxo-dGTP pyrophosphatase MutT (NUDIX family)
MPHIHYAMDKTVEVFVVHKQKVLLRKHDKYGIWLSVGGHIELSEDPNEAALREVREEVGLDVDLVPTSYVLETDKEKYKHLVVPAFMNRHNINSTHEHVTLVYFAKSDSDLIEEGESEKSKGCKWFDLSDLENLKEGITDTVKSYAKSAIKQVSSLNG